MVPITAVVLPAAAELFIKNSERATEKSVVLFLQKILELFDFLFHMCYNIKKFYKEKCYPKLRLDNEGGFL